MLQKLKITIFSLCLVGIVISAHAAKVDDFIPSDSFVYLKLRDIDEVYAEIELSENWEKMEMLLTNAIPEMQEIDQGMDAFQTLFRTSLPEFIETVGYQTGFAMWEQEVADIKVETIVPQGQDVEVKVKQVADINAGIVVHSGGNLSELQRFTKIITGMIGMTEGKLTLDAGEHLKVKYNTLELPDMFITYGFVSEFLVVGIGENGFEKLIDTYRKKAPAIQKNSAYTNVSKKFDEGQVTAFVNTQMALPLMEDIDAAAQKELQIFKTVFAQLNLLEAGPMLQIRTEFTPNSPDSKVSLFLKEGTELATLKGLSGEENLFVAASPALLEGVWQIVRDELNNNAADEVYAFISFLEEILNLNLEEDIIAGLTGELALSVDNFAQFDPDALDALNINLEGTLEIDAVGVETNGGLIFSPNNPSKWNQIGNSLSNLQNTSVSQTEYNGTTVSEFSSNIYYGKKDGLFFLGFSEEQMRAIADGLQVKKKPAYLKQLPKTPTMFVQLNLPEALELSAGAPPADMLIATPEEIQPLLAWVSVKENEAVLEAALSEKETPIEVLAKLAPFILWSMGNR